MGVQQLDNAPVSPASSYRRDLDTPKDTIKHIPKRKIHTKKLNGYLYLFFLGFIGICAFFNYFGLCFFPTPAYREDFRHRFHELWGSERIKGKWKGGHREMTDMTFVLLFLGLPTLLGAILFSGANVVPGELVGFAKMLSRFLKRRPFGRFTKLSIGEFLFLSLVAFANIFWFYTKIKMYKPRMKTVEQTWKRVGLAFGFNCLVCMAALCLPATRDCFWMEAMGIDYANGVKYHRWIGYLLFFFLFAHCIPYYVAWYRENKLWDEALPCFDCDLASRYGRHAWINVFGEIGLLSMIVMVITSFEYVRRKYYEVFYYSHYLFILFIICSCLHYSNFIIWLFPSICIYIIHRIIANSSCSRPTEIVNFEALSGGVTRIIFRRSMQQGGDYNAGEFIYLRVPILSKLQWHAMSLSSYPQEKPDTFTVHIKALGEWSRDLHSLAIQSKEQGILPLIYVDGFYGTKSFDFEHYPILVFFAGGIGGTPLLSILGHLLSLLENGQDIRCKEIYLYWSSREMGLFEEFRSLLDKIRKFDPNQEIFHINLHFTGNAQIQDEMIDINNTKSAFPLIDTKNTLKRPYKRNYQTPLTRIALIVFVFGISALVIMFLRYDFKFYGKERKNRHLWPLQRFMELILMVVASALGYCIAFLEPREQSFKSSTVSNSTAFEKDTSPFNFNVINGRYNVNDIINSLHHKYHSSVQYHGIGIWISGPKTLIDTVYYAAGEHDALYDVHHEEFEL